jgi:hypothetical protein
MVERDLGEATIVYEDPREGTVEWTRQNEHVAYFQDHWIVRVNEDESETDEVRRIPAQRVHYVERSVEEFEEEVSTLRDQVQSFAGDLQEKLLGGESGGSRRESGNRLGSESEGRDSRSP